MVEILGVFVAFAIGMYAERWRHRRVMRSLRGLELAPRVERRT
jgi:hypothetical protein